MNLTKHNKIEPSSKVAKNSRRGVFHAVLLKKIISLQALFIVFNYWPIVSRVPTESSSKTIYPILFKAKIKDTKTRPSTFSRRKKITNVLENFLISC